MGGMVGVCFACGRTLELGRFCPECGAEQQKATPPVDQLIGRIIADRYEIIGLINVGGMGSVYDARHRALDRPVAIKFIHPHLLTAEDVITRFMIEAQTASRINHPNVVSIYDFGRTGAEDGGRPFLVMERLEGPDLATVMEREGLLPIARVFRILLQTLAAIAEAHRVGVVHRDIKPENIVLEPRKGSEIVKVVDFGIARPGSTQRVTEKGRVMGTPVYMAPEQTTGEAVGASVDIYAAGMILFQLLTGELPFDGPSAETILLQQRTARRPDPREIAPHRGIEAELAAVCLRAIDIDPAARFGSAEELAMAIEGAAEAYGGIPQARASRPSEASLSGRFFSSRDGGPASAAPSTLPSAHMLRANESSPASGPAASGRARELGLIERYLSGDPREGAFLIWGAEGSGRSWLIEWAESFATENGYAVVSVPGQPYPLSEVSYTGLRALIAALLPDQSHEVLARGQAQADGPSQRGLRTVFSPSLLTPAPDSSPRGEVLAAFSWALSRAMQERGRVLICIDDIDLLDRMSARTILDYLSLGLTAGPRFLLTSTRAPDGWLPDNAEVLTLAGIEPEIAAKLAGYYGSHVQQRGEALPALYVSELGRAAPPSGLDRIPQTLSALVEGRLRNLSRGTLDTLEAIAVLGQGTFEEIATLVPKTVDVRGAIDSLELRSIVVERRGTYATSHPIFSRVAKALAPRGVLDELHVRVTEMFLDRAASIELVAHHAARGRPDFATYVFIDDCARLRLLHGDDEGAISTLWDGLHAAHRQALLGEPDASQAWIAFGRKLGAALLGASREDEAMGVLNEVLDQAGPLDLERARVLAQLADVADHRKKLAFASARRREALHIAERLGDEALADELRSSIASRSSGS